MLTIYYHRDFDGIASAAILAHILGAVRGEGDLSWRGVNHDVRAGWERFSKRDRFAVVDFFFHPRAEYWFDHHPTTFIKESWKELYTPSDTHRWNTSALSCPPVILEHAEARWGYEIPDRFRELHRWSDKIDGARFDSVEEVLFDDAPALRIMRALTVAPTPSWSDRIVTALVDSDLETVASSEEIEKRHQRACSNREKALKQFPPTVMHIRDSVLMYDASSNSIRRERFAPFYHHPEVHFAVGIIPTRGVAAHHRWRESLESARRRDRHRGHLRDLRGRRAQGGRRGQPREPSGVPARRAGDHAQAARGGAAARALEWVNQEPPSIKRLLTPETSAATPRGTSPAGAGAG